MRYFFKSSLFIIALVLVFSIGRQAFALTVTPVRIEISGNPGQTVQHDITLINETKALQVYYTSYANFEAQGESGNPAFVEPKDDIGTWMSTDSSIALKPGQSKTVTVKIEIPKDAEPGGHFGAVFFGTLPNNTGSSSVGIGAKIGALVLLSVNGDIKEAGGLLDFSTIDHSTFYKTLPISFIYRFKNDGNDYVKPTGTITMHDLVYFPADRLDANLSSGNILPRSTRRFEIDWVKNKRPEGYVKPSGAIASFFDQVGYEWNNFAIGPYFVKLDLLYGTSATRVSKTIFIFVFPWELIICLIIIIFIVFWGGKKLIRRYNRHIIRKAGTGMSMPNTANNV